MPKRILWNSRSARGWGLRSVSISSPGGTRRTRSMISRMIPLLKDSTIVSVRLSRRYARRCIFCSATSTPSKAQSTHELALSADDTFTAPVSAGRSATDLGDGPTLRDFLAGAKSNDISESGGSSDTCSSTSKGSSNSHLGAVELDLGTRSMFKNLPSTGLDDLDLGSPRAKPARANGTFFIETYGCQMNVSDSEVVRAILLEAGFREASCLEEAGVVLANTCAIRERAEGKVWDRLKYLSSIR